MQIFQFSVLQFAQQIYNKNAYPHGYDILQVLPVLLATDIQFNTLCASVVLVCSIADSKVLCLNIHPP
uniref:Uncharacterized protein n=1 Tax=Arundo donax TaxID=35708 RepID=A0A0A9CBH3_ARUDO